MALTRKEIYKRSKKNNPKKQMLISTKYRAKKKGLEFNLTEDDINIPSHCPVLNIPLFFSTGRQCDNSPSIDRIDSTKGYVPDNIQVVSWRCNDLKKDGTLDEFVNIVMYMAKHSIL